MLAQAPRAFALSLAILASSCGAKSGLNVAEEDVAEEDASGERSDAAAPRPGIEVCNFLDDDGDGVADDGLACIFLDGEPIRAQESERCGPAWYSYNEPDLESANPRPDFRRSGQVFVAVTQGDDCEGAHVGLIADLPDDGSGGQLNASFVVSTDGAGRLSVSDEPGECALDEATGIGRCDWVWQPCCTDGFLVAVGRRGCVTMTVSDPEGVTDLFVLDGSERLIPRDFGESFQVCAIIQPPA